MTDWDETRTANLVRLFHERPIMSAAEMARALGGNLSRNAVIGKLHRMGLQRGRKPSRPSGERKPRRNNNPLGYGWSKPKRHPKLLSAPSELTALNELRKPEPIKQRRTDMPEPASLQLSLMDLTSLTCKWAHGDPGTLGFGFCGHRVHLSLPYCEHHADRAYGREERAGWTPERRAKFFRARARSTGEAVPA